MKYFQVITTFKNYFIYRQQHLSPQSTTSGLSIGVSLLTTINEEVA